MTDQPRGAPNEPIVRRDQSCFGLLSVILSGSYSVLRCQLSGPDALVWLAPMRPLAGGGNVLARASAQAGRDDGGPGRGGAQDRTSDTGSFAAMSPQRTMPGCTTRGFIPRSRSFRPSPELTKR